MDYLKFNWSIEALVLGVLVLSLGLFLVWFKRETIDALSWKWVKWTPIFALALLALSLFKPGWIMEKKYFHKPYVLIAMDVSESFKLGKILNLDSAYKSIAQMIKEQYQLKDVSTKICFFSSKSTTPMEFDSIGKMDFPDTLGILSSIPNLMSKVRAIPHKERPRGIFLISDGRSNLNSNFYESYSGLPPVFPILFSNPPIRDFQLDSLEVAQNDSRDSLEVRVAYRHWGAKAQPFILKTFYGRSYQKKLEIKPPETPSNSSGPYISNINFKLAGLGPESLLVHIDSGAANEYPYNDSLKASVTGNDGGKKAMYVIVPLSGPDERWMLQLMKNEGGKNIQLLTQSNLENISLKSTDLIWISRNNNSDMGLANRKKLKNNSTVIYGAPNKAFPLKNTGKGEILNFSSDAKISVSSEAAGFYTYLEMPLRNFSKKTWKVYPLENFSQCILRVEDKNKTGCLFGRIKENQYGFFLTDFWKMMFSPNEKLLAKEYLANIISGTAAYLSEIHGKPKIMVRGELYEGKTIHFAASLPGKNKDIQNKLRIEITGPAMNASHKLDSWVGNVSEWDLELPAGSYNIGLVSKDSSRHLLAELNLEIKPARSLELSKIGFHKSSLKEIAQSTGGGLFMGEKILQEKANWLPEINSGEIKESKKISKRFYNTGYSAMLLIALMSGYWLFRKKYLLD